MKIALNIPFIKSFLYTFILMIVAFFLLSFFLGSLSKGKKNTPIKTLHYAVFYGNIKAVKRLIQQGANVNEKNKGGSTPLHAIAPISSNVGEKERLKIAQLLIDNNADVNAQNNKGWAPIHKTAGRRYLQITQLLINNNADVNVQNNKGDTPLHYTLSDANIKTLQLLVKNKANVNAQNKEGDTPLHFAAFHGHSISTQWLISYKANVNATNNNGWTPLFKAVQWEKSVAHILINNKANVHAKNKHGDTPLHIAALYGCARSAKLLINNNANVHARNNDDSTPLHFAALRGYQRTKQGLARITWKEQLKKLKKWCTQHPEIVQMLIKNQVNVNAKDKDGHTPLYHARSNNLRDIASLLTQNGGTCSFFCSLFFSLSSLFIFFCFLFFWL